MEPIRLVKLHQCLIECDLVDYVAHLEWCEQHLGARGQRWQCMILHKPGPSGNSLDFSVWYHFSFDSAEDAMWFRMNGIAS